MIASLRSRSNTESGKIERDYQVIGWWGLALAAFGIAVLIFALASSLPD